MRICLRKVDLPLSPAPSSNIFTSRFTYVFSRFRHLSISLDFLCWSTSLLDKRQLGIQTIAVREGRKSAIFVVTTSWIHHWRGRARSCARSRQLGRKLTPSRFVRVTFILIKAWTTLKNELLNIKIIIFNNRRPRFVFCFVFKANTCYLSPYQLSR